MDHISFGYDLVEAIRPKRLVELGAYNGMSYF
ncbi:MAG: class I SAM-dependent methyltransferase, partial [Halieaceae bacterium]|nr:class I SAM-dependent methyltransferase [Halieaceae bacterium]